MFGKKNMEEIPKEETKVWECTSEECNCWVRDNFKSNEQETPECPICKGEMEEATKVIQVLENHSKHNFK